MKKNVLNFHKEWFSELKERLNSYADKISIKIQKIEEEKPYQMDSDERLLKMFFLHLDEYVQRTEEIGGFGVGGMEPDISFPATIKAKTKKNITEKNSLISAIQRYWGDTSKSYIYGNFRGCIFQSATMLDEGLKLKILEENLKDDFEKYLKKRKPHGKKLRPTLGIQIDYFEYKGNTLSKKDIKIAREVNKLRNEHIHLLVEEEPEDIFSRNKRDEFVSLDEFKGSPPIKISKNGGIIGDNVTFRVDFIKGTQGIVYKYKKDAETCLDKSREILRKLYPSPGNLE